jgi:hypothetical protein
VNKWASCSLGGLGYFEFKISFHVNLFLEIKDNIFKGLRKSRTRFIDLKEFNNFN